MSTDVGGIIKIAILDVEFHPTINTMHVDWFITAIYCYERWDFGTFNKMSERKEMIFNVRVRIVIALLITLPIRVLGSIIKSHPKNIHIGVKNTA